MKSNDLREARFLILIVAVGLFLSGVTIFPAIPELRWLVRILGGEGPPGAGPLPELHAWISTVLSALEETSRSHPYLFYAGDWLAFAHILLAVLFLGAMKDPVRNIWVIQFGLIACAGILPVAWICGPARGIPWYWSLVDSSFAFAAGAALLRAHALIRRVPPPEALD